MAKKPARYVPSFERYVTLRTLARTIGLTLRQAGEYDFQRKQFGNK